MIWNHFPIGSFLSIIQYLPTQKTVYLVNSVPTGQLE